MNNNINQELFRRYAPKKKLEIIESLTDKELLNVKESTVIRIVKETGTFNYGSKRDKHLNISLGRRKGNDWNSTLDSIDYSRGRIFVELYLQYENTDTSIFEYWYRFLQPATTWGSIMEVIEWAIREPITSPTMKATRPNASSLFCWSMSTVSMPTN